MDIDTNCIVPLSDVSGGNLYAIIFRDSEKYNPWYINVANADNSSYSAATKDLIDIVEMKLDTDSSSSNVSPSISQTEASAKRVIWDCVESKAIVALRNKLNELEQVQDESKLHQRDKAKLKNMKKDNAALVAAYHDFQRHNYVIEISEHPACELYEDILRARFMELKHCCIITGETTGVTMAHIVPKRPGSFKRAIYCYRGSRSFLWQREFITVHDLRNVLPLKEEWHHEYDEFRMAFYLDEFDKQWHLYVPRKKVNAHRCKAWDIVHGDNSADKLGKISQRLNAFVKNNKTFKRALMGQFFQVVKKWGYSDGVLKDYSHQGLPSVRGQRVQRSSNHKNQNRPFSTMDTIKGSSVDTQHA